jgi:hypothetical protein
MFIFGYFSPIDTLAPYYCTYSLSDFTQLIGSTLLTNLGQDYLSAKVVIYYQTFIFLIKYISYRPIKIKANNRLYPTIGLPELSFDLTILEQVTSVCLIFLSFATVISESNKIWNSKTDKL